MKKLRTGQKVTLHSALLIWRGLGNWMVRDGVLHCADLMVHSKALDELYNRSLILATFPVLSTD